MKTLRKRYLAPLALAWTGLAFGQAATVVPESGAVMPRPGIEIDRPTAQETCYPRGTVDAAGRIPTDKPLCDDNFELFGTPDAPASSAPRSVPETIDSRTDSGRSTLLR